MVNFWSFITAAIGLHAVVEEWEETALDLGTQPSTSMMCMCLACCFVIIIVDDKQAAGPTESIYVHPFRGLVGCRATASNQKKKKQKETKTIKWIVLKFVHSLLSLAGCFSLHRIIGRQLLLLLWWCWGRREGWIGLSCIISREGCTTISLF